MFLKIIVLVFAINLEWTNAYAYKLCKPATMDQSTKPYRSLVYNGRLNWRIINLFTVGMLITDLAIVLVFTKVLVVIGFKCIDSFCLIL